MKVVGKDNFDRETVSDFLKAEGLTAEEAQAMCDELNAGPEDHDRSTWFVVKPDDYKLYVWEP